MIGVRLFLAQRITALVMAPLVVIHLGLMIYAIRGGISAEEILSRTRNNLYWTTFYGLFVVAASIHGAIGLRAIIGETFDLSRRMLGFFTTLLMMIFLALGFQSVIAVVS